LLVTESLLTANLGRPNPVIVGASGVHLELEDGRRLLDAVSAVGVTCLGYGNAEIVAAMTSQAEVLPYAHALRFDTEPLRLLAAEVSAVAPDNINHAYFVSGGSEAVESAIKYARQYWLEVNRPGKWKVIGRWPSFHGSTIFTQSVGWHNARRARQRPMLTDLPHIEAPNTYRGCGHCRAAGGCTLACADELERAIIREGADSISAFIAEPVGGAATGAAVPPSEYFPAIREICDRHEVLLIADEIITGFGRTGGWFAMGHWNIEPDIMTFGKGIGAGYAPLAGIAVSDESIGSFRGGSRRFEHNFTYAGHAVACAAGRAVLNRLREDELVDRVARLEPAFFDSLEAARESPIVGDIRGRGFLAAVELVASRTTKAVFPSELTIAQRVSDAAMANGLLVYPCTGGVDGAGDHLLIMPAFVMPEENLAEIGPMLAQALATVAAELAPLTE
jgi:adenosylmethionine-8-amino-7-oxononanoate aminotransferase